MNNYIKNYLVSSNEIIEKMIENEQFIGSVKIAADIIVNALKNGKKILMAGNGGSASDAQHFAGEFLSKFKLSRKPLRAISLNTDTSVMSAISNDFGYQKVFSRQLQSIADSGDVFIAISTSGNSLNIVDGVLEANKKKVITIGLTGSQDCQLDLYCNHTVKIPSNETPKIQEAHIMVIHILCGLIEEKLFVNQ